MELWTERYRPQKVSEILGQKKAAEDVIGWFDAWKPGKNKDRALFLHGPPGVGKSLLIEILAKEGGLHLIVLNASDNRKSSEIEKLISETKMHSIFHRGKVILLDEVDGISGHERGAAAAIARLIKESAFPVVLIANDPWKPGLRSVRGFCRMVRFSKVRADSIEKLLDEICKKEGVRPKGDVLKHLARWSQGDVRAAVSDLQMIAGWNRDVDDEDLDILGYRERESGVFDVLPAVFANRNLKSARKLMETLDKDPDEFFLWVETNVPEVFKDADSLANAFEIISQADIMRSRVMKQQNWRFRRIMSDMVAGISLAAGTATEDGGSKIGFVKYKPPKRIAELAKGRERRALLSSVARKIGNATHCSARVAKRDVLPYIKIVLKDKKQGKQLAEWLDLDKDEVEVLGGC